VDGMKTDSGMTVSNGAWHQLTTLIVGLLLTIPAAVVRGDDAPQLKAGLWEFSRSNGGTPSGTPPMTAQKCTDPAKLFGEKPKMESCEFSPMTRSGNTYSFTADCTIHGTPLTSKTAIVVDGDSAYTMTVDSQGEVLVARRIGDCDQ
jgi:hypothetical protein